VIKFSQCHVLQPQDAEFNLQAEHFEAAYWQDKPGSEPLDGGRGGSLRILLNGRNAILRHYYRGGWVTRLLSDQYLWFGKSLSRPWREWNILQRAVKADLPVPEAIAGCVCRTGLWYRAALITAYLEDTETLTRRLQRERLRRADWHRLGTLIKHMHAAGIRHADLTSDNVLIDSQLRFYLIDFDKARIMRRLDDWQFLPLHRFKRSIDKRNQKQALSFSEDDWQALMDGYEATRAIRALEEKKFHILPIIALSASAVADFRRIAFEAGMNEFVTKPFQPIELNQQLSKFLISAN